MHNIRCARCGYSSSTTTIVSTIPCPPFPLSELICDRQDVTSSWETAFRLFARPRKQSQGRLTEQAARCRANFTLTRIYVSEVARSSGWGWKGCGELRREREREYNAGASGVRASLEPGARRAAISRTSPVSGDDPSFRHLITRLRALLRGASFCFGGE